MRLRTIKLLSFVIFGVLLLVIVLLPQSHRGRILKANAQAAPLYSISGRIFDDFNKDGLKDNGEPNYSGSVRIAISPNIGNVIVNADGSYTINNLPSGTYTVSYLSVPLTYQITSPLNGPPPSFKVTVGVNCNTNGAPGATCQ